MAVGKEFDKAKKALPPSQPAMMELYWCLHHFNGQQDSIPSHPIEVPELEDLKVTPEWGPEPGTERPPATSLPKPLPHDYEPAPVSGDTWNQYLDHLLEREGYRNTVYKDSLGKPTVGVGHLVLPEDNLKVGDTISDEQVRDLLEKDASKAYRAAIEQANELGINDSEFVIALGSVNYQLGTGWRQKFPETWQHIKEGNYDQAIENIENSKWARQTPTRTNDFTAALREVQAGGHNALGPEFASKAEGKPVEPAPPGTGPAARENPAQTSAPGNALT